MTDDKSQEPAVEVEEGSSDVKLPAWKVVAFSGVLLMIVLGVFEVVAHVGLKVTRG